jgi:hypothetical protein
MKKYGISVVLPSRNEADSIGNVVKQIDAGLQAYGIAHDSILINVDNSATHDTLMAFEAVKTITAKEAIATRGIGKGDNVLAGVRRGLTYGAEYFLIFDTDLVSIESSWVERFLECLQKGTDLVIPMYARYWIEGGTTNHVCMPVLYALTGRFVAQPIAGDFGLNARLATLLLRKEPTDDQRRYGIDVFISATAILSGMRVAQVRLSRKIHKPSFDNTEATFMGETAMMFAMLPEYSAQLNAKEPSEPVNVDLLPAPPISPARLAARKEAAAQLLGQSGADVPRMDENSWVTTLGEHLRRALTGDEEGHAIAKSLLPHFYLHTVDFLSDPKDVATATAYIVKQSTRLRSHVLEIGLIRAE